METKNLKGKAKLPFKKLQLYSGVKHVDTKSIQLSLK